MKKTETVYFAGGCFWCITPVFKETMGVISVISGYSGGDETAPSYSDVKAQRTGHRETISVEYDPEQVSFGELLEIYLSSVDLFDGGGQFIDRGFSYTLAIYFTSEEQYRLAEKRIKDIETEFGKKVFISLEPFNSFFPAEEEHQDYYLKNPQDFEQELISSGRRAKEKPYKKTKS